MRNILLMIAVLFGLNAEARTAYDAYRMPSSGNLPGWGKIDLANGTTGSAPLATDLAGGLGGQVCYQNAVNDTVFLANGTAGQILQSNGTTLAPSWVNASGGTVTAVSVASANGFAGSSSGGATPALTLSTSITGILKGDGTAISAAIAGDFPTLNQDTTGKSASTDALKSATTTINVSSATAPTSGQVLTATSGTAATWQTPSGGGGTASVKFTLEGATVPYTSINGPHYQTTTQSLTTVNISALDSGTSGSTTVQVNQYRSGSLLSSATASLSASSGNPSGSAAALSGTLSLLAGDIITVDVNSVAGGNPSELSVEY